MPTYTSHRSFFFVTGDTCYAYDGDNAAIAIEISVNPDPSSLHKSIETARRYTSDPKDLRDLDLARRALTQAEIAIDDGDAREAYRCGIEVSRYLARFEARPLLRHRIKGGKATKALTPEQEKLALGIIAEKQRQNSALSKTAACVRAAAELSKSHGIDVSKDTLLRLLRSRE